MLSDSTIETFLTGHLLADKLTDFTADQQSAAIAMANRDISGELGRPVTDADPEDLHAAVAEQAIYLLLNQAELLSGGGREVAAERIEGLGSRTYRPSRKCSGSVLSPRAQALIAGHLAGITPIFRG